MPGFLVTHPQDKISGKAVRLGGNDEKRGPTKPTTRGWPVLRHVWETETGVESRVHAKDDRIFVHIINSSIRNIFL